LLDSLEEGATAMSIILFILFGLIVGFLARAIMPGKQSMGFVATALLGIVGSFLGGFVGNLLAHRPVLQLQSSGIVGSVIGALVILAIVTWAGKRRGAFA
jgi:uncharacterized membrane protein YeaQ/YmgE (transglycosylase-associated protein family)